MPNIKSAKKRVLIAKVNNERNKADKSALKTTQIGRASCRERV